MAATKVKGLQIWCRRMTEGYPHVEIANFTSSWRDGMAFCALIHRFRPDLIDYDSLSPENVFENCKLAFEVAEQELDIPAFLEAEDMEELKAPDKLSVITYVSQYYNILSPLPQLGGPGVRVKFSNKTISGKKRPTTDSDSNYAPTAKRAPAKETKENTAVTKSKAISAASGDICGICQNRVYLLERHVEGGKLYHRSCFRHSELSPTNKVYTRSPFLSPSLNSETSTFTYPSTNNSSSVISGTEKGGKDVSHRAADETKITALVASISKTSESAGTKHHQLDDPVTENTKKSKLQSKISLDEEKAKKTSAIIERLQNLKAKYSSNKSSEVNNALPLSGKEARKIERKREEVLASHKHVEESSKGSRRSMPLVLHQNDKPTLGASKDYLVGPASTTATATIPSSSSSTLEILTAKTTASKSDSFTVSTTNTSKVSVPAKSRSEDTQLRDNFTDVKNREKLLESKPDTAVFKKSKDSEAAFLGKSDLDSSERLKTAQPVARPRTSAPRSVGGVSNNDAVLTKQALRTSADLRVQDLTPKPTPRKSVFENLKKESISEQPKIHERKKLASEQPKILEQKKSVSEQPKILEQKKSVSEQPKILEQKKSVSEQPKIPEWKKSTLEQPKISERKKSALHKETDIDELDSSGLSSVISSLPLPSSAPPPLPESAPPPLPASYPVGEINPSLTHRGIRKQSSEMTSQEAKSSFILKMDETNQKSVSSANTSQDIHHEACSSIATSHERTELKHSYKSSAEDTSELTSVSSQTTETPKAVTRTKSDRPLDRQRSSPISTNESKLNVYDGAAENDIESKGLTSLFEVRDNESSSPVSTNVTLTPPITLSSPPIFVPIFESSSANLDINNENSLKLSTESPVNELSQFIVPTLNIISSSKSVGDSTIIVPTEEIAISDIDLAQPKILDIESFNSPQSMDIISEETYRQVDSPVNIIDENTDANYESKHVLNLVVKEDKKKSEDDDSKNNCEQNNHQPTTEKLSSDESMIMLSVKQNIVSCDNDDLESNESSLKQVMTEEKDVKKYLSYETCNEKNKALAKEDVKKGLLYETYNDENNESAKEDVEKGHSFETYKGAHKESTKKDVKKELSSESFNYANKESAKKEFLSETSSDTNEESAKCESVPQKPPRLLKMLRLANQEKQAHKTIETNIEKMSHQKLFPSESNVTADDVMQASFLHPLIKPDTEPAVTKTTDEVKELPQWKKDIEARKKKLREDIAKSESEPIRFKHLREKGLRKTYTNSDSVSQMENIYENQNKLVTSESINDDIKDSASLSEQSYSISNLQGESEKRLISLAGLNNELEENWKKINNEEISHKRREQLKESYKSQINNEVQNNEIADSLIENKTDRWKDPELDAAALRTKLKSAEANFDISSSEKTSDSKTDPKVEQVRDEIGVNVLKYISGAEDESSNLVNTTTKNNINSDITASIMIKPLSNKSENINSVTTVSEPQYESDGENIQTISINDPTILKSVDSDSSEELRTNEDEEKQSSSESVHSESCHISDVKFLQEMDLKGDTLLETVNLDTETFSKSNGGEDAGNRPVSVLSEGKLVLQTNNNTGGNNDKQGSPKMRRKITVIGRNNKEIFQSSPTSPLPMKKIEVDTKFNFEESCSDFEISLTESTAKLTIHDKNSPPPRPPPPRLHHKTVHPLQMSAIELQQKLLDIDSQLTDLELRGRDLEESIRSENTLDKDDDALINDWFRMVCERNELVRKEADLVHISKQQDLENEQEHIESQLRYLIGKSEDCKSVEEKQEEAYLIKRKLELVEQRSKIVDSMDEDRIRYEKEDNNIKMMRDSGLWRNSTGALSSVLEKKVSNSVFYS